MLCLCGALLNPDVAPAALPEPYRQRPSRAAGSFIGQATSRRGARRPAIRSAERPGAQERVRRTFSLAGTASGGVAPP